jgi:Holliday junction resolvasome RuvABC endonuclease subunit
VNQCFYKIIGIDPGGNTGISIMTIDDEFNIKDIEPLTLKLDDYTKSTNSETRSVDRLIALDSVITDILESHDPIAVGMEIAFINKRFPLSGLSLSKYTAVLDVAIRKALPRTVVFRLAPKLIKSEVGAGGKAIKDDMYENLLSISEVSRYILDNEQCDEHNIDATAICYVILKLLKQDPTVLLSKRE